ncbi:hydrogenase 1, small subunit [Escherichia coli]|nr:hydrogenase 1, small subunit [Escherichia coli]
MNNEETFYQAMRRQGVTRRSFLKYCSLAATSLGLGAGMAPKIAWALENKPRIPVVWIHGLECTCCTESFIRSAHPLAKDVILSLISLDYDDTLMAAAGTQAEEVFEDIIAQYNGKYILAVEGNPPLGEQGDVLYQQRDDRLLRNSNVPLPEPVRLSPGEPARPGAACRPRDPIRRRQRLSTKSSPTNLLSKYLAARRSRM